VKIRTFLVCACEPTVSVNKLIKTQINQIGAPFTRKKTKL